MTTKIIVKRKTCTLVFCMVGDDLDQALFQASRRVKQHPRCEEYLDLCYSALREYFNHRNGVGKDGVRCPVCKVLTGDEP